MKSEIVVSRDADLNRAHRATRAAHCRLCYLGAGADDGRGSVFEASYCLQYGALWSLPRNPHYSCLEGRRHAVRRHPQKATQATERSRTSNLSLTKRSRSRLRYGGTKPAAGEGASLKHRTASGTMLQRRSLGTRDLLPKKPLFQTELHRH